jgi:hypothetical protein
MHSHFADENIVHFLTNAASPQQTVQCQPTNGHLVFLTHRPLYLQTRIPNLELVHLVSINVHRNESNDSYLHIW